jgi:hypothetical protein
VLLEFYITQGYSIFITSECAPLVEAAKLDRFIYNSKFISDNLLKRYKFNCIDIESGTLLSLLDENIKSNNPNSIITTVKRPEESGIKGVMDLKGVGAYMDIAAIDKSLINGKDFYNISKSVEVKTNLFTSIISYEKYEYLCLRYWASEWLILDHVDPQVKALTDLYLVKYKEKFDSKLFLNNLEKDHQKHLINEFDSIQSKSLKDYSLYEMMPLILKEDGRILLSDTGVKIKTQCSALEFNLVNQKFSEKDCDFNKISKLVEQSYEKKSIFPSYIENLLIDQDNRYGSNVTRGLTQKIYKHWLSEKIVEKYDTSICLK